MLALRLKCPECGHQREPDPEVAAKDVRESMGWAAVYAPRQPANGTERAAALLRQYAEGNFAGTGQGGTLGLSQIWKKGWQ